MEDCVDEDDNKGEEEEESDPEQWTDDDSRHDEPMALAVDVITYISTCGMFHFMLLTTSYTTHWSLGVCIECHTLTFLSCSQILMFLTSYQAESSLSICNWDTFVDGCMVAFSAAHLDRHVCRATLLLSGPLWSSHTPSLACCTIPKDLCTIKILAQMHWYPPRLRTETMTQDGGRKCSVRARAVPRQFANA